MLNSLRSAAAALLAAASIGNAAHADPFLTMTANSASPDCQDVTGLSTVYPYPGCAVADASDVTFTVTMTGDTSPIELGTDSGYGNEAFSQNTDGSYSVLPDVFASNPGQGILIYAFPSDNGSVSTGIFVLLQPGLVPVAVTPTAAAVITNAPYSFTASGGALQGVGSAYGYTWSFTSNGNNSGASLDNQGDYVAGPIWGVTDTIQVSDPYGSTTTATVQVLAPPPAPTITVFANSTVSSDCNNVAGLGLDVWLSDGTAATHPECAVASASDVTFTVQVTGDTGPINWFTSLTGPVTATVNDGVYSISGDQLPIGEFMQLEVSLADSTVGTQWVSQLFLIIQPGVSPFSISPTSTTVPSGGSTLFVASGGDTHGVIGLYRYNWSFADGGNNSGGTIDWTGTYTAGPISGVTDTIEGSDSFGASATATIDVVAPLPFVTLTATSISPDCVSVVGTTATQGQSPQCAVTSEAEATFTVQVTADTSPLVWAVNTAGTITPIDNHDGTFSISTDYFPIGQFCEIYVYPADDVSAQAQIWLIVQPSLTAMSVSPQSTTVGANTTLTFTPSGGVPNGRLVDGYSWGFTDGGNNSGGSIDQNGNYTAGPTYGATDTIQVSDPFGASATATIQVVPLATVTLTANSPGAPGCAGVSAVSGGSLGLCIIQPGQPVSFTYQLSNDSGGVTWNVVAVYGNSSVPMTPNTNLDGSYSFPFAFTPPEGFVTLAIDDTGSQAGIVILVNGTPPLTVTPTTGSVPSGYTLDLSASGGAGGYTWSILTNLSGGTIESIDAADVQYTAGPAGGAQDVIQVADSSGATATATITVPGPTTTSACGPPGVAFAPGENVSGLVMFEDLWPKNGDLDFNDQTIAYNYELALDDSLNVSELQVNLSVLAIGATIHNGLYLHLPLPSNTAVSGVETIGGQNVSLVQVTANNEPDLVFQLVTDTRAQFGPDTFINTDPNTAIQPASAIMLTLTFPTPVPLDPSLAPYDLFIAQTLSPQHEIHLPQYPGTANMDTSLFNTYDDNSSSSPQGLHFVNQNGLPFALAVPQVINWAQETVAIDQVYEDIVTFASSNGSYNQDWYANASATGLAFTTGKGVAAPSPLPYADLSGCALWSQVGSGNGTTLALRTDGTLWGWGDNSSGEAGIGNDAPLSTPVEIGAGFKTFSTSPIGFTLAIQRDGSLWAWGDETNGTLGNGSASGEQDFPEQIGGDTDWAAVSAGTFSSAALKTDGTLWVWGIVYGPNCCGGIQGAAVTVPTQVGTDTDWSVAVAGQGFFAGIKRDGSLWTWGDNTYGELGDGTTTPQASPEKIGDHFLSAAAGNDNVVAVKTDGSIWTWGDNPFGELGNGTNGGGWGGASTAFVSTPTQIATGNFVAVSAGSHACAARAADGEVWMWGWNLGGQIDDGSSGDIVDVPSLIATSARFYTVSVGIIHATAIALDGSIWEWGDNAEFEFGNGNQGTSFAPVQLH